MFIGHASMIHRLFLAPASVHLLVPWPYSVVCYIAAAAVAVAVVVAAYKKGSSSSSIAVAVEAAVGAETTREV